MKAIIYTMMIGFLGFGVATAQTSLKEIKQEVMDTELLKNWKTGETKKIQEQSITKLKDESDGTTRTNLMYSPPTHNLIMHPTLMVMPVEVQKAGTVYIVVDRESEEAVNANNFTVQVFDKSGMVELMVETPESQPGKEFKYGVWYNQFSVEVPAYAGTEFNVVVTDNTTGDKVNYLVVANHEQNVFEMEKRLAGR